MKAYQLSSSQVLYKVLIGLLFWCSGCANVFADQQKPNVVLIVVDTLGARYVGAVQAELDSKVSDDTPRIDALAKQGVVFRRAYSTSSWTKPAIASTFTSQFPAHHGTTSIHAPFKPQQPTLAEVLKQSGYHTIGVVSHTLIAPKSGFGRGFDSYQMIKLTKNVHNSITSQDVTADAITLLSKHLKSESIKPFFLFVHYFDPHYDYQHHPEYNRTASYSGPLKPGQDIRELRKLIPTLTDSDKNYLKNLYREEIAYTDNQIGVLLDFLESHDQAPNTFVGLTADHGEEFFEHGWLGHTRTLYEELVHVPLIMRGPGIAANIAVKSPVSILDIMPTIIELVGADKIASNMQGISLLPYAKRGGTEPPQRDVILEVDFHSAAIDTSKIGVVRGNQKLIRDKRSGAHELLDLEKDPKELRDISSAHPKETQQLEKVLDAFKSKWGSSESQAQDDDDEDSVENATPQELEQLKSLGYL